MAENKSHLALVVPGLPRAQAPKAQPVTDPEKHPWVGRTGVFELKTGLRVSGRIIAVFPEWLDTDNGTIRVDAIVYARWMGPEEISIARGGPVTPRW